MGILETAKDVVGLVQKADNIELYRDVLDLQRQIMDLLDENRALREEVVALQRAKDIGASLVFSANFYYRRLNESGESEGPFCSLCWDVDGKLVRVMNSADGERWCPKRH